jgi:hypothetical protein
MPKPPAIVVGDGRLKVAESKEVYDILILDAFSSDAIPLHLLTLDALEKVFLPHLSQRGTIAYHITNQYIDLEGPLERLANATGLQGLVKHDRPNSSGHLSDGSPSDWVVLTRNPSMSQALKTNGWQNMKRGTGIPTIEFPRLSEFRMNTIDARKLTFEAAREDSELGLIGRSQIIIFLRSAYEAFDASGWTPAALEKPSEKEVKAA